jgi:hypothetical protein
MITNTLKKLTIIFLGIAVATSSAQALPLEEFYNYLYNTNTNQFTVGQYTFVDVGVSSSFDGEPDVETDNVRDIDDDSAELNGEVDMNDFRNGIVFFVYGQDEDMVEDTEDDYDSYDEVRDDEEDDDFEVIRVDRDLDGRDDFSRDVRGLEDDERYYVVLCVEFEDDNNDETLRCGDVEDFETDRNGNNNDENPDVDTEDAHEIDDDSAELNGEVDMNDFNNGRVFFVWGEDEDGVDDVEREDRYSDIDEDGDDLQKQIVDNDLDGQQSYRLDIFSLDDNTDIYFRICVEYEDEDNDDTIECGSVEEFETDN